MLVRGSAEEESLIKFCEVLCSGTEEAILNALEQLLTEIDPELFKTVPISIPMGFNNGEEAGVTPLFLAVYKEMPKLVSRFLELGLPVDKGMACDNPDLNGRTPLMMACELNHSEMAGNILQYNPDLFQATDSGRNVLMRVESVKICHLIIDAAKKNNCLDKLLTQVDKDGSSVFDIVCDAGNLDVLRELMKIEKYYLHINIKRLFGISQQTIKKLPDKSKELSDLGTDLVHAMASKLTHVAINGTEQEILQEIENTINEYSVQHIVGLCNMVTIGHRNSDDILIGYSLLGHAIICRCNALTARLIELNVKLDKHTVCEDDPTYNNLSVLKLACETDDVNSIRALLDKNINIMQTSDSGISALMFVKSVEACRLLVDHAKKNNCLNELLALKTKSNLTAYEYAVTNGRVDVVRELMQVENYHQHINMRYFLHQARCSAFNHPEKARELDEICNEIRKHVTPYAGMEYKEGGYDQSPASAYYTLFKKFYPVFLPPTKEKAVKKAIAQFYALLQSPDVCVKYLRFLNAEFKRYYREKYHCEFSQLDPNTYEFKLIDGIYLPFPKSNYVPLNKHSALQEFLVSLHRKHGLAQTASKWIGFIPEAEAIKMIEEGEFYTEDRFGTGLFHNKLSHKWQTALLICGVEDEVIDMEYGDKSHPDKLHIKDILHAMVNQKHLDDYVNKEVSFFTSICDERFMSRVTFGDPHRLGSVIMHQGKSLEMDAISDDMIDSFCKAVLRLLAVYNQHCPSRVLDINAFAEKMNDMQTQLFAIPDYLKKHSIMRDIGKGRTGKNLAEKSELCYRQ